MIRRVSGFRGMFRPVRPNRRMQRLKESLHRNSVVQFRHRGTDRTEIVKYSSILRVLGP